MEVLIERKNNCFQFTLDRFLGKHDIISLLGSNKKISKSALNHLIKSIKDEIPLIEERMKILKEVYII